MIPNLDIFRIESSVYFGAAQRKPLKAPRIA